MALLDELRMLTQEEVCELLHTHINTLQTLREVGVIRATRIGKHYMFSQEEIAKFQHDYVGYDLANRVKAIEAYKKVTAATVTQNN